MREAKKPSFVRLERKSNEELKTLTKYLCEVHSDNICVDILVKLINV